MSQLAKLREQIDACRAGDADLRLPEMAELSGAVEKDSDLAHELVASQGLDVVITRALHDVPIPEGIVDRLLRNVKDTADLEFEVAPRAAAGEPTDVVQRRISRHQWTLISTSLAVTVVAVVAGFLFWPRPSRVVSPAELSSAVNDWMIQVQSPTMAWTAVGPKKLPADITGGLRFVGPPIAWQRIQPAGQRKWYSSTKVVSLAPAGQPRALLFVIRSSAKLPVPPTPTKGFRLSLTGGLAATAWQSPSAHVLYVLVVEERGRQLEDFLRDRTAA